MTLLKTAFTIALATATSTSALADAAWSATEYQAQVAELSRAPRKLYIECVLRSAGTSCDEVQRNYFSSYPATIGPASNAAEALISVKITDQALPNGGTRVNLEFSSRPELSITTFILPLDLEPGLDGVTIQNRILMNIQKGVLVHYKVISATEAEGKSTVVYDISNGSEPKPPSKFSSGPWSIGLGVSGNSMSSTNDGLENSNTSASGEVFVNYSTPKVRAAVSSQGYYSASKVPGPDGTEYKSSNFDRSVHLLAAYTFKKRWSVALLGGQVAQPGSNVEMKRYYGAGLEWALVPFRMNENKEFAFQIGADRNEMDLKDPNGRGNIREEFLLAFAKIRLYWTLMQDKAILNSSMRVATNLNHPGYETYYADLGFRYQVTTAIGLNASTSYSYRAKSLTFPGTPDYSNPLQTGFLSGGKGRSLNVSMGFNVILGNGILSIRDRRWQ